MPLKAKLSLTTKSSLENLSAKELGQVFHNMRRINTDNDWDGVSAAVQLKHTYRGIEVEISSENPVYADKRALILDKSATKDSTGFIIDHHPPIPTKATHPNLRIILFAPNCNIPTSRLTYLALQRRVPKSPPDEVGLFLSATAEITDGFYYEATNKGSLYDLYHQPNSFQRTKQFEFDNTIKIESDIYASADILNLVAIKDPDYAFRLALGFYKKLPSDTKELIGMLDPKNRKLVENFLEFLRYFDKSFENMIIANTRVKLLENKCVEGFGRYIIEKMRRADFSPTNYMLFRGNAVSIRLSDLDAGSDMLTFVRDRLSERGLLLKEKGRPEGNIGGIMAGAHKFTFEEEISYEDFKKILRAEDGVSSE